VKIKIQNINVIIFIALTINSCSKKNDQPDYPSRIIDSISVGTNPIDIAVLPNGEYAYVTNTGSDNVSVIRLSDKTVITTIPVGSGPFKLTALPNGNYIYVTNDDSNNVSVIRTSDRYPTAIMSM
jgi:YVTN family beta-propeller protein